MSVVVTGAAGFLGNRLAQNLAKRGAQVVLCDQIEPPVVPAGARALVGPLEETLDAAIASDTRAVVATMVVPHDASIEAGEFSWDDPMHAGNAHLHLHRHPELL